MKKEFVMRGQTASGSTEVLEFGGRQKENKNMAYRIIEFVISPSVMNTDFEGCGIITAGKTALDPVNPNFSQESVIASGFMGTSASQPYPTKIQFVINDTFMITQNLLLTVQDTNTASQIPINWQCRFEAVKMTDAETAATNFRQYTIFDE